MHPDLKKINPHKILIINTFGIGDVLFTTPFISNLKTNFPNAFIGYLANRRTTVFLEGNPQIDKVYVYERDEFKAASAQSKRSFLNKVKASLDEIKKEKFDVVFDFSLNRSINFLTQWAGIKHRIGFNFRNRSPHLTVKIPFDGFERKHVVDYYLDILTFLDLKVYSKELVMPIGPQDRKWVEDFLKTNGCQASDRLIGVIPGGGESWGKQACFRRWSSENYAKLIDKLIENYPMKIILMGAKQEEEICQRVKDHSRAEPIDAVGQTSLGQLVALLERCHLVILNDGGPLHVAVAAKTKTVSIFGPVDEKVYGPYGDAHKHLVVKKNLLCQPCYRRFRMTDCAHVSCLTTLSVDEVFEKVKQLL
ncbi:MAG TPA: glycosyltransferase family 9 protein [Candidatus Omnitrophota bacterium]|nr:glycosyltransferase family 9 protein [Candidatus Omnitrophota bacterium]